MRETALPSRSGAAGAAGTAAGTAAAASDAGDATALARLLPPPPAASSVASAAEIATSAAALARSMIAAASSIPAEVAISTSERPRSRPPPSPPPPPPPLVSVKTCDPLDDAPPISRLVVGLTGLGVTDSCDGFFCNPFRLESSAAPDDWRRGEAALVAPATKLDALSGLVLIGLGASLALLSVLASCCETAPAALLTTLAALSALDSAADTARTIRLPCGVPVGASFKASTSPAAALSATIHFSRWSSRSTQQSSSSRLPHSFFRNEMLKATRRGSLGGRSRRNGEASTILSATVASSSLIVPRSCLRILSVLSPMASSAVL